MSLRHSPRMVLRILAAVVLTRTTLPLVDTVSRTDLLRLQGSLGGLPPGRVEDSQTFSLEGHGVPRCLRHILRLSGSQGGSLSR